MRQKREVRKIACIGEVMIELSATGGGDAKIGVAGDTYNTAVYLAKTLLPGDVTISYVTALGNDIYFDRIRAEFKIHGIDDSCVECRTGKLPRLYAIGPDENGERSFSCWRSDSAARTLFSEPGEVTLDILDRFDLVLPSGITMAILAPKVRSALTARLRAFSRSGGAVVFDSNYRPFLWEDPRTAREISGDLWSITDVALPSLDDEMALFGVAGEPEVVRRSRATGVKRGALKRGDRGPLNLSAPQPVGGL